MSSFTPRLLSPTAAEPDPGKHVNYSLGMVLGVDDFTQEFAYLSGRDQWLARDLLGYGTVSGLSVGVDVESSGPQVSVTPGVALSPRGRLIRVAPGQCAGLNGWLASHRAELLAFLGSPAENRAALRLFVVLGYRECPTDMIPIPGQPCRSEEEVTAASRLADDFKLELRLTAPDQQEEDALRDFVAWLGQVEITDAEESMISVAEFEEAIRAAAYLDSTPPSSPPDFMYGSPPAALRIHTSLAYEYLRAAFRVWVTELRPRWQTRWAGKGPGCTGSGGSGGGGRREEDVVLLAELQLRLVRTGSGSDWMVEDAEGVTIHQERRPYLMHLRMVQEWLLGERRASPEGATAFSLASHLVPSFLVTPETTYGQTPKPGISLDYARADHTHGTPPPPTLAGDVTGSVEAASVERIRGVEVDPASPSDSQVLTFVAADNTWRAADPPRPSANVKHGTAYGQSPIVGTSNLYARADHSHGTPPPPAPPTLGGDATGPVENTIVARLRGVLVDPALPSDGQVLAYNATLSRWGATTLPAVTPPPKPANSVVSETGFGQAANAGISSAFSRADHTHGTPPAPPPPTLAGDVTGVVGATVVGKLQGVNVNPASPSNGQVLTFDGASGRWSGATPAVPPAPGSNIVSANSFGQPSAVGSSASYARADHTHGTPTLPVPGGDVGGSITGMTVRGLQGRPLLPVTPSDKQVLTFDAAQNGWKPGPPPAQAGDFVQRPPNQPAFFIVAAGIIRGDDPSAPPNDRFNNLRIVKTETGRVLVHFDGYVEPGLNNIQYIVKVLPVAPPFPGTISVNFEKFLSEKEGFSLLVTFIPVPVASYNTLFITNTPAPVDGETIQSLSFMVEVSRYERRNQKLAWVR